MHKRAVTVAFGVVFAFVLAASSVRADAIHANKFIGQLKASQLRNLDLPNVNCADEQGYFSAVLHSNNGKHVGFTAASVNRGPKIGLVKPGPRVSITQNPEPATMLLLGTGLIAAGAAVRHRKRK